MTTYVKALGEPLSELAAKQIAEAYGLVGHEARIAQAVLEMIVEDEAYVNYGLSRFVSDMIDSLGVHDCPWDDPEWFDHTLLVSPS